jgi:NAD(P)-dependent dehydrogenase (short-subunit alcohol dehydrogenase family)
MRSATSSEQVESMLRQLTARRSGDPEADIGRAVVHLVGPDASYVTGCTLVVDGGAFSG